ncbi:MAG: PAS domain-containing protein, partial [Bacillota bacterium]
MIENNKTVSFYRKILLIIPATYIIYCLIYYYFEGITDPMDIGTRIFIIVLFSFFYFLSYRNMWLKENIEKVTYFLTLLPIVQLFYYNYKLGFELELAVTTIFVILLFNLIFKAGKVNLRVNLLLMLLLALILKASAGSLVFSALYFASYMLIAGLSYFIKYYYEQQHKRIKETRELLENLSNQAPGVFYQYQIFPDGDLAFPYISEGVYEIYELTAEEVKEDPSKVFKKIHPQDYRKVINSIKKATEKLKVWHQEYRVLLPEKGQKWLEGRAKPEKLNNGSVLWH